MSTRSSITVKHSDGKYHSVYCHLDGHPSHHTKILRENYNSQELAEKLVSYGYMSVLAESCEKPEGHSYENQIEGYTVYYGRDRGEDNVDTLIFDDYRNINKYQYNYLYENGAWEIT